MRVRSNWKCHGVATWVTTQDLQQYHNGPYILHVPWLTLHWSYAAAAFSITYCY
ncbi:uncharacterized protein LY79DRAFT_573104 [Colletotrichum navitas]|uniref:Uncharacterized protein n=1 Tax=Colletotrichum navitas TaxID=681940 RepID=A0AAD8PK88_9PEZI|nr:uncharacterized protein LY79DRAFT_573104 [Colletotrichum navitas]KAK1565934.1 hypothetical protein LY79DRAFT_573104 [Colletotrichum navitas]